MCGIGICDRLSAMGYAKGPQCYPVRRRGSARLRLVSAACAVACSTPLRSSVFGKTHAQDLGTRDAFYNLLRFFLILYTLVSLMPI